MAAERARSGFEVSFPDDIRVGLLRGNRKAGHEEGQYEDEFPRVFHAWPRTKHEGRLFLDRGASRWARAHLAVKGTGRHVLGRGTSTHVRAPSRGGAIEICSRFGGVLAQVLRLRCR